MSLFLESKVTFAGREIADMNAEDLRKLLNTVDAVIYCLGPTPHTRGVTTEQIEFFNSTLPRRIGGLARLLSIPFINFSSDQAEFRSEGHQKNSGALNARDLGGIYSIAKTKSHSPEYVSLRFAYVGFSPYPEKPSFCGGLLQSATEQVPFRYKESLFNPIDSIGLARSVECVLENYEFLVSGHPVLDVGASLPGLKSQFCSQFLDFFYPQARFSLVEPSGFTSNRGLNVPPMFSDLCSREGILDRLLHAYKAGVKW